MIVAISERRIGCDDQPLLLGHSSMAVARIKVNEPSASASGDADVPASVVFLLLLADAKTSFVGGVALRTTFVWK